MSRNHWTIGIDFGTSNTAAAHTNPIKGTVEAVNLSHDRTTMSSSVYVESPDQIDVGDVAINKAETNPAGFVPAPKRVIPQQMFQVNGYDVPSSMPVAAVLSSVVQRVAREHGNEQPSELVLTHPEAWSSNEIKVLLDAAAQLGLSAATITTISEPQAAAHYYSQAKSLEPGQRIAVFDFGGGTLDIAVLQANEDETFDVIAARGDNTLGGKNFDALMRTWVDQQLEDRNPELLDYFRTKAPLQERHALEDSIRRAKELLSEASYATVVASGRGGTERFQITRGEFEELIAPALDKAEELTEVTLADAGIHSSDDLVALYLTGGSSRIPIVQERLKKFGRLATLDDPKTVVAQGAISALRPIVRGMTPQKMGAPEPTPAPGVGGTPTYLPPQANPYGGQQPTSSVATPTQTPPPHTDLAAKRKGPSGRTIGIMVAAVVAVVAIAGISGYRYLLASSDETTQTTQAEPQTAGADATSESSSTSAAADGKLDSQDAVLAKVPANIKDGTENCRVDGTTSSGNLRVRCEVKPLAEESKYFGRTSEYDKPGLSFAIDPNEARYEQHKITEGLYDDRGQENNTLGNADNTASAHITGPTTVDNEFNGRYTNTETGLMITSYDFKDMASAEEYFKSKALL